jgi:hypothetical protein
MGFGLLLLGYMTMLGSFPDSSAIYMYMWYAVFIPVSGGFIILAAFFKLQEYNIYFKIMKWLSVLYVLVLLALMPFYIMELSDEVNAVFDYTSKIIRIFLLFAFHFFLLTGIHALAKSVDNQQILQSAKLNIYFTYIYFALCIFSIFGLAGTYYILLTFVAGLVYFCRNMLCIYRCFLYITYEGHDEELERKIQAKKNKK